MTRRIVFGSYIFKYKIQWKKKKNLCDILKYFLFPFPFLPLKFIKQQKERQKPTPSVSTTSYGSTVIGIDPE